MDKKSGKKFFTIKITSNLICDNYVFQKKFLKNTAKLLPIHKNLSEKSIKKNLDLDCLKWEKFVNCKGLNVCVLFCTIIIIIHIVTTNYENI